MSSKRRLRRKSCESKKKRTKQDANKYAYDCRQRGIELYPYKCKFCGGWHIGHPKLKGRSSRMRIAHNASQGF